MRRKFIPAKLLHFYTFISTLSKTISNTRTLLIPASEDVPLWNQRWKTQWADGPSSLLLPSMSQYTGCWYEAEELGF